MKTIYKYMLGVSLISAGLLLLISKLNTAAVKPHEVEITFISGRKDTVNINAQRVYLYNGCVVADNTDGGIAQGHKTLACHVETIREL
jgi:hypothetical protein